MNSRILPFARWIVLVVCIAVLCTIFSPAASAQSTPPDFAAIDTYIAAQMQAMRLPGLALGIVQDDQIVYLTGYGVADPSGRPVTPQTPFRLASVSKTVTAIAIMQLLVHPMTLHPNRPWSYLSPAVRQSSRTSL